MNVLRPRLVPSLSLRQADHFGLRVRRLQTRRDASTLPSRSRRTFFIVSGIFVYALGAYSLYLYKLVSDPDPTSSSALATVLPAQRDVSSRYDEAADEFDGQVNWIERTSGLNRLRKRLVKQASGQVLETSVGTGRNFKFYDLKKCQSITFLDQSGPMLKVAMQKWKELYPRAPSGTKVSFRKQPATDPLPVPDGGFDTIVQTMGACSTPDPAETLKYLASLLKPGSGRLLLLEHGRGSWDWINSYLDRTAETHAAKFGCWYNRDIGAVLKESGLVIEKVQRPHWWNFGTVWFIEARPQVQKGS